MKINKLIVYFLLIFSTNLTLGQGTLWKQWDYRFGGMKEDNITCIVQTSDGGFIIGGCSNSGVTGDKTDISRGQEDYWIIKTDSDGNKQWDRTYGGNGHDLLHSIQQTNDGGYILGGISNSGISGDKAQNTQGNADYWIVKTDSLGTMQWNVDFGGTDVDACLSLQQTNDGGYILGGYSISPASGDKTQDTRGYVDYWVVKIDSYGNKQWDKDFGGMYFDYFYSLQQTADRGYILGGYSDSPISGDKTHDPWGCSGTDYWIVKTDSLGNKEWDREFGGIGGTDHLYSLKQTVDGGYILGGTSNCFLDGDKTQTNWDSTGHTTDYWIVKTDSLGNKLWDTVLGGTNNDIFTGLSITHDGGYLISGDSNSPISGNKSENNLGQKQTWLVKTDSAGNKLWDKTIFTAGLDLSGLALQTNDGCYVTANNSSSATGGYKTQPAWFDTNGNSTYDYWIIKFCDSTLTMSTNQSNDFQLIFSIYPNPVADEITIELKLNHKQNSVIEIYDVFGQKVRVLHDGIINEGVWTSRFDLSFLPGGVYLISIPGEKIITKRIIKL